MHDFCLLLDAFHMHGFTAVPASLSTALSYIFSALTPAAHPCLLCSSTVQKVGISFKHLDFLDIYFCAKAEITELGRSRQSATAFCEQKFGRNDFQKDKEKRREQGKLNFAENRFIFFYSIWTLNQRLPPYSEH